jgi:hypothetical protein
MIKAVILGTKAPAFDGGSTDSIHICAENAAIGVHRLFEPETKLQAEAFRDPQ